MDNTFYISTENISAEELFTAFSSGSSVALAEDSIQAIRKCREYLEDKISTNKDLIYGINTGFGSLYGKRISKSELESLQQNLVRSHACGTGAEIPQEIVRLIILLKIKSLAFGHSGVRVALVERLIFFYNHDVTPVIYEQGSLGASGDLAPLAHLSLALIGEGEVYYKGEKMNAAELHQKLNIDPITLKAKEGLALLNGTQFMLAFGLWAVSNAKKYLGLANMIGAASLDAFDGRKEPFHQLLQKIRPHKGQITCAREVLNWLEGSEILTQAKKHVQDPYSFRCIPQVHGASWDAIAYAESIIETELNSVTDNPNIFPEEDLIISGGNFHGQPLALTMDFLAIALAELGSISERRTYQLISGRRNLPPYLVAKPGLNSGLMIPQYTAASIVSQNKQLCTPATVDSIVSSNGQEDHVSMGANAATKLYKVADNLLTILSIEWMTACQALEFRKPLRTSSELEGKIHSYRKIVPFLSTDRVLQMDILRTRLYLIT